MREFVRRRRHAVVTGLMLALCPPPICLGQEALRQPRLPTLTTVIQARKLTEGQAKQRYPVHFRAVVTYSADDDLFVQDSTGGIWVARSEGMARPKVGQLLDLEGFTTQTDFAPDIGQPHWRAEGEARMPPPQHPTYEQMASSSQDGKWVELEGTVRSAIDVQPDQNITRHLRLSLVVPGGKLLVEIPEFRSGSEQLVDARVRVQGVCATLFNSNNQLFGIIIRTPSLQYVKVLQSAPTDSFAIPSRRIAGIQRFTFEGTPGHRVRLQGVVTGYLPNRAFFIRDESGSLYVESNQAPGLRPGDRVDVIGFPGIVETRPALQDALFRRIGVAPAPVPVRITPEEALQKMQDNLVSLEGRLTATSLLPNERVLMLRQGDRMFAAILNDEIASLNPASLREGSLLRVTGICLVQRDITSGQGQAGHVDRTPRSFRIHFRETWKCWNRPPG